MIKVNKSGFLNRKVYVLGILFFLAFSNLNAADTPANCNTPLVGYGRLVNRADTTNTNRGNVVNGNLRDSVYIRINNTSLTKPIISVKDTYKTWKTGTRVGFTLKTEGANITSSNLAFFRIKTYNAGLLKETITTSSTPALELTYIGSTRGKARISFITTQDFDEVVLERATASTQSFTSISIFYAFVEPASGCNYICRKNLTNNNFSSITSVSDVAGIGASVLDKDNVIDTTLTNYTTLSVPIGALNAFRAGVRLNIGRTIPAYSDVGFVVSPGGALLMANILSSLSIKTYLGGVEKESFPFTSILDVSILDATTDKRLYKITPTKEFDAVAVVSSSILGIGAITKVYYGFVNDLTDTDKDTFPDCIDKCPGGDDGMDSNGNGIPDACDTACTFEAGPDIYIHPQATSYDFSSLNLGTWSMLSQPSGAAATVTSAGLVQNMTIAGTYTVQVTSGSCSDVINIYRNDLVSPECNKPIVGPNVAFFVPTGLNYCLSCVSILTTPNIIDGDLSNSFDLSSASLTYSGNVALTAIQNTTQTYPASTYAGFVVEPTGSVFTSTLLSRIRIRTYLNGVQAEDIALNSASAKVDLLPNSGNKIRLYIQTTKPFNGISLAYTSPLTGLTGLKIYHAFTEPLAGCPTATCQNYVKALNGYQATISYTRTGNGSGQANCSTCRVENISNLLDTDETNYATLYQSVSDATTEVAVKTGYQIPIGREVGFTISNVTNILAPTITSPVAMLDNVIGIGTFKDGVVQEIFYPKFTAAPATNMKIGVIDAATGKARVSVTPTKPYDEVELSFSAISNFTQVNIHNFFVVKDTDGDGVPDCVDKCAIGNDNIDADGNGVPDACGITISNDFSCANNELKVTISNIPSGTTYNYSLYKQGTSLGTFSDVSGGKSISVIPGVSGTQNYSIQATPTAGGSSYLLQNLSLLIHPSRAQWAPQNSSSSTWKDNNNWIDITTTDNTHAYPIWCTDVVIPSDAVSYPTLVSGDECRDITFKDGASVGKIQLLKYRHAYVEFNPKRNQWSMLHAPLRYMYSADYHADRSWENPISPKIFMRYFDVEYKTNSKSNPDGVKGTSIGSFSRSFSNLKVPLGLGQSFVLWVNGNPYPDSSFTSSSSYNFPRRNSVGEDVLYSMHNEKGEWIGDSFYMSPRGGNISEETTWTSGSTPVYNSRYRFNYESISTNGSSFTVPTVGGDIIMVGNPFMSHLDFNQFVSDNSSTINNYYRIWDGDKFYTYIGSGTPQWSGITDLSTSSGDSPVSANIAPMQAFFVDPKVSGAFNITFTPQASVADATSKLRSGEKQRENILKMGLKMNGKESYAILACAPMASDNYSKDEDISKLFSFDESYPEIYTVVGGNAIEVNLVGTEATEQQIPLGIKTTATGKIEFSVKGVEELTAYNNIHLFDKAENKRYDLRETNAVSFTKNQEDAVEGRFYIVMNGRNLAIDPDESDDNISVKTDGGDITVKSNRMIKELYLYDILGKTRYMDDAVEKYNESFDISGFSGVYLLRIVTESGEKVHKVFF